MAFLDAWLPLNNQVRLLSVNRYLYPLSAKIGFTDCRQNIRHGDLNKLQTRLLERQLSGHCRSAWRLEKGT